MVSENFVFVLSFIQTLHKSAGVSDVVDRGILIPGPGDESHVRQPRHVLNVSIYCTRSVQGRVQCDVGTMVQCTIVPGIHTGVQGDFVQYLVLRTLEEYNYTPLLYSTLVEHAVQVLLSPEVHSE